jgi:hypothetical protein
MNGALAPGHMTRKHVTTYHMGAWELKRFLKPFIPFYYARGPIMTHMPMCLAVRGWRHPNRPIVWTIFMNYSVLGLNTNLERVLGSSTQRCVLANQRQQA